MATKALLHRLLILIARIRTLKSLNYKEKRLYFDDIDLYELSSTITTPFYIYSENIIRNNIHEYTTSASNDVTFCYSVKANSNLSILKLISSLGLGFDVVSGGELAKVLKAGGLPNKIVYSGVGKSPEEIQFALDKCILCFNVESSSELELINDIAKSKGMRANVSLRVNPDISVDTHPYISTGMKNSKFGIPYKDALNVYTKAKNLSNIDITGIDFHIGSQITSPKPYIESIDSIKKLICKLKENGINLEHIDVGGGIGIKYDNEQVISKPKYVQSIIKELEGLNLKIIFEPGRSIIGDAGILVTKVQYIKESEDKNFLVVDASMSELLRPPLYEAYHKITPIIQGDKEKKIFDVVGPVCESTDFLGLDRELAVKENDYLVIEDAGAYGFVLSSNYNSRPRPSEHLISKNKIILIRKRESIEQMLTNEIEL